MLVLAIEALGHLAGLAFAEYRRFARRQPDEKVESLVRRFSTGSVGQLRELLTYSISATDELASTKDDLIFARGGSREVVDAATEFVVAKHAIRAAMKTGARDTHEVVRQASREERDVGVAWIEFWSEFRDYRNVFFHPERHPWYEFREYFTAMAPLLEHAVISVLTCRLTSPILTRELLYTAVTRAQDRLVVVGTEETIRAAVARPAARASGLRAQLWR